jgi:hypothetical protein
MQEMILADPECCLGRDIDLKNIYPKKMKKKKKKTLVYPVLSLPIQLVQLGSGIFDIKVKTLFVKKFKLFLFKIIFFYLF